MRPWSLPGTNRLRFALHGGQREQSPEINVLTEKLHTSLSGTYLAASVNLTFSVGAAIRQPDDDSTFQDHAATLVQQAEQALNLAKLTGGGKSVIWNRANADSPLLPVDRLANIFTSESEKDYRNMLLLWDTIAVVSTGSEIRNCRGICRSRQADAQTIQNRAFSGNRPGRSCVIGYPLRP